MIRRRIVYLLAVIGSLVFYMAYQQWFSWILLQVIIFFSWLSLLLSIRAMLQLRIDLDVPVSTPVGSDEHIDLKTSCKLPIPPYKSKIRITKPLTGERWTLKPGAKLPSEHCGRLHIRLHRPGVSDYLGIFRLKVKKTTEQSVFVLPKPIETDIPTTLTKYLEPQWRPKPGGGFAENHEIRQYHPGDNLNQIHWKLSAKVGELMLREPMQPERGLMLLTMDLSGTAAVLDTKLGQLLWMSQWLLEREIPFDIRVLTANGIDHWTIRTDADITKCIETLLDTPLAKKGSIRDRYFKAAWRHHIGGEQGEA